MTAKLGLLCLSLWPALGASAGLPLRFEQNVGQADAEVRYITHGPGYTALLTPARVTFRSHGSALKMNLLGADPYAAATGLDILSGRVNYLIGDDPAKWYRDVPTYARLECKNIYPGVDIVYYGEQGELEYDFVLRPGADPRRIRLGFEGMRGMHVNADGELILQMAEGEFRHRIPRVYQVQKGSRRKVKGHYTVRGNSEVVFDIGDYDRASPLVIDPLVVFSTYLGGAGNDTATSIAVDSTGSVYVTGWTESTDFSGGPVSRLGGGRGVDVYVAKLNAAGNSLAYLTYLGGRGDDRGYGLAVDSSGSVVIAGWTYSSDFPTATPAQAQLAGTRNGFIAKLNPSGNGLIFSTFWGGNGYSSCRGVALDSQGNVFVAGETESSNFPISNPIQAANRGGQDAFVSKFSGAGARQYSTYLGGLGDDNATAIAVDSTGNAYITGATYSPNFPVASPLQSTLRGGQDVFVAKVNAAGNALVYSTYIGGTGGTIGFPEMGAGIAVDSGGYAYVTGSTSSQNFPAVNALNSSLSGGEDAFVLKLSASGNAIVYSTFLGGYGVDFGAAITVSNSGNAYVTGYTASSDFPSVSPVQTSNAGGYDVFVAKLSSAGNTLELATYFGGLGSDSGNAIALDLGNAVYLAGQTLSTDFPLNGAMQLFKRGAMSAFVLKIQVKYTISGQITVSGGGTRLAGAVVSLSGSVNASTTTDGSGNYVFPDLTAGGNHTITPSHAGYTFNPGSQFVNNQFISQIVNFVAVSIPAAANLALGRTASQSSFFSSAFVAANAVDGNTNGAFSGGALSITNPEANAWWQVDLGGAALVTSIAIWNRTDCCGSRLSDYWLFVSDTPFASTDTPATLQNRTGVWSSHQTTAPNPTANIVVNNIQGRYVRLQLTGTDYLTLAEVRVNGLWVGGSPPPPASNLAPGKTASQSSNFGGTPASNAIDGNTGGTFAGGSLAITNADANPWWQVDLGALATISSIAIWNRTDCCGNRLGDYWVFISDTPFASSDTPTTLQSRSGVWSNHQTAAPNPATTLVLNSVQGRYIRVQLTGVPYLTLAEVQVYGTLAAGSPPTISNLALVKTASQSSTFSVASAAAKAVDGSTNGAYSSASLSITNPEAAAWWQVDLGAASDLSSIVIWNRTDCCGSRLSDYWVFVSDTPFGSSDTPASLQNRSGVWSSHQATPPGPSSTIPTSGVRGRYVRVQLTGTDYLTLAEVQVMGSVP